jgi:hypothetical protein
MMSNAAVPPPPSAVTALAGDGKGDAGGAGWWRVEAEGGAVCPKEL